jgi:NTE family protein
MSEEKPVSSSLSPVSRTPSDELENPAPGIALCLSGGGYRAMLFHTGTVMRLNDLGYLPKLDRISSVSGGSITAGVLGCNWSKLNFDASGIARALTEFFVKPIRGLASESIDVSSVLEGALLPGHAAGRIQSAYRKHLFGNATLQDLPDRPRFVINATNVQSGVLWRFSKPYMRDYRVGEVKNPTVPLAVAVSASSAFPPFLSPVELDLDPKLFTAGSGTDLQKEPFISKVVLTDGGVYDNLGLETAWKRYRTILVSDAGGAVGPEEGPHTDWGRHAYRILNIINSQVGALRKRQVVDSFGLNLRDGAYWGIGGDIAHYGLPDALPCPYDKTVAIACTATRLKALDSATQDRIINWGYAACDAAMRKHVLTGAAAPGGFPYPASALG